MTTELGHDDDTGTVHCHLCEWSKYCPKGIEEVEFEIAKHLKEAHGKTLRYRRKEETGENVDIPT